MMLADVAADRIDDDVGQLNAILDDKIIAIEIEKIVGGGEGRALVPLEKWMVAGDAEQQGDRKRNHVALTIMPMVDRAGDRALKQGEIAQDMRLAGLRNGQIVEFDEEVGGQPDRLIRQGGRWSWGSGR